MRKIDVGSMKNWSGVDRSHWIYYQMFNSTLSKIMLLFRGGSQVRGCNAWVQKCKHTQASEYSSKDADTSKTTVFHAY